MNHVPDDALEAIDAFGDGLLRGDPSPVRQRLRSDLRLRIEPLALEDAENRTVARCRFETEHTQSPPRLRDRGSYIKTIVDNVERRLEPWGIDPPEAYEYTETVDGWHRYEGTLEYL